MASPASGTSSNHLKLEYNPYLNGTILDRVFRWDKKYGEYRWPPLFSRLPDTHEVVINSTLMINSRRYMAYGREAIYALGKSNRTKPRESSGTSAAPRDYFLYQMQVSQTPFCYRRYQAFAQRMTLNVLCDESSPPQPYPASLRYIDLVSNFPGSWLFISDWPQSDVQASLSPSLGISVSDANSSNAKLLSQLLSHTSKLEHHPNLLCILSSQAELLKFHSDVILPQLRGKHTRRKLRIDLT